VKTGKSWWHWHLGRFVILLLLALALLGLVWPAAAQLPAPSTSSPAAPVELQPGKLPAKPQVRAALGTEDALHSGPDSPVPPPDTPYLYLPMVFAGYGHDVLVAESFEGAVIPPTDWDLIPTNPVYTWEIWPFVPPFPPPTYPGPFDGSYSAACDTVGLVQDEVLLSPPFKSATAQLQFYSFGDDSFWYDHSLNVWVVVGAWDGVDDVLVYTANGDWIVDPSHHYLWSPSTVDLTPYLQQDTPVRIAFQYEAGDDGDLVGLDAILITR